MIVKPWQAGVRGYVGPYRPCLSVKYPSFGMANAAGFVQSSSLEACDMWLLIIPLRRVATGRRRTPLRRSRVTCRHARLLDRTAVVGSYGGMAESVPALVAQTRSDIADFWLRSVRSRRRGVPGPPALRRRHLDHGVRVIGAVSLASM